MASHGMRATTDIAIYNDLPIVKPLARTWIIDNKIYRVVAKNRGQGTIVLLNKHDDQMYTILWSDFLRNRKRAYTVARAADLINRHHTWLKRQIWMGNVLEPIYQTPDGKFDPDLGRWAKNPLYSEDDIFKIRDTMVERKEVTVHGNPGNVTYIPTVQELRRRMGLDMLIYTKTPDGRFIPVWEESI